MLVHSSHKQLSFPALGFWLVLLVLSLGSFSLSGCSSNSSHALGNAQIKSVYDRVMQSGTIKCGYITYPPFCMKDPNTGKLSGLFVEVVEAAAKNLGLKAAWTEEVGWGSMIEGLQTDRYDIVGSGVWINSTRARVVDFSEPLFYSGLCAYTRCNDNRFVNNLKAINSSTARIATIDGEMSSMIAQSQFPKAKLLSLSQMTDISQVMLSVVQNKADITFQEPGSAWFFLKNNPGTLKNITAQKPLRLFADALVMKRGQYEFKSMLDRALEELASSGKIDELLDKYEPYPGSYYRRASLIRPQDKRDSQGSTIAAGSHTL